jgi:hypothetical protein
MYAATLVNKQHTQPEAAGMAWAVFQFSAHHALLQCLLALL